MKILSTSWNFFQNDTNEWKVAKDGCRIMISQICEYIGKKEESYLFIGSMAIPQMNINGIHILDNREYLPTTKRTKENINEWQVAIKKAFHESLLKIKPDYVLIHDIGDFSMNCMRVCEEIKQPFSYVNHLFVGDRIENSREQNWEDEFYSHIDWKTIAVGSGVKKRIIKKYPRIKDNNIQVIPNGTLYNGENVESDINIQYGLSEKKILACVGSLQPRKNQLQLVSAFMQLSAYYRKKIGIIICGKELKNNIIKEELLESVKKNGLEESIYYFGECEKEELKKVYTIAEGLIMPSLSEGLSLVATEILSYGKPIIMFSDNETADDINDNNVAVLAKDHSDKALANAIIEWFKRDWDEDYIKEYSKYYSMERVADDYIRYCREMIERDEQNVWK